jgi:Domain of unknown function (DUF4214)
MHAKTTSRRVGVMSLLCAAALVLSAGLAPASGAATVANTNYVKALYLDLLDRPEPGNSAGVEFWANRLDARSRGSVVRSMQRSTTEYYSNIVEANYELLLDRSADAAGRDFYVTAWHDRTKTLSDVVITLVGSREYFDNVGDDVATFVDVAYADILGREPSASERSSALALVAGSGRSALARRLENGNERRQKTVLFAYRNFLGREASTAEWNFWVQKLNAGLRAEDFDLAVLTSGEYYAANRD